MSTSPNTNAATSTSNKKTIASESSKALGNALAFIGRVKEKRANGDISSSSSGKKFNPIRVDDMKINEVRKTRGVVLNKIFQCMAEKEAAWDNEATRNTLSILLMNYLEAAAFLRSNYLWVKEVRRQDEEEYQRSLEYNGEAQRALLISFWGIEKVFEEKGQTADDINEIGKMWYKAPPFWTELLEEYEGVDLSAFDKQILLKIDGVNTKEKTNDVIDKFTKKKKTMTTKYCFPKGRIMYESLSIFPANFLKEIFPTCHTIVLEQQKAREEAEKVTSKRKRDQGTVEENNRMEKKLRTLAEDKDCGLPLDMYSDNEFGLGFELDD